jgi:hypothetical protein
MAKKKAQLSTHQEILWERSSSGIKEVNQGPPSSPATSVGSQQSSTSRSGEGGSTQGANHLVSSSKKAKNGISPLMVAMATTAADTGPAHLLIVRVHS